MWVALSFSSVFAAVMNVPSTLMVASMDVKSEGVLMPDGTWNVNKTGAVSNGYNVVAGKKYYFDIYAYGTAVDRKFAYVKVLINNGIVRKFNVSAALTAYRVEYTPTVSGVAMLKIHSDIPVTGRNLYLNNVIASSPSGDTVLPHIRYSATYGRNVASTTPAEFKFTVLDDGSGPDSSATQCIMDGVVATGCVSPKVYPNLAVGSHTFVVKAFDKAGNTASSAPYTFQVQAGAGAFSISSIKALSASSIQVGFGASANAKSYAIQYGTSSGVYTNSIANVASPVTLTGLASAQKYYVRVVASATTNASSTALGSFAISSVTPLSSSSLRVAFGSSANAASYTLKYGTTPGDFSTVVSATAVSPATITGLASGKTYYVMVTAAGGGTTKDANAQVNGTTLSSTDPETSQSYYDLEISQPRAGLTTENRFYKAYPGLLYEVRAAVLGGAYPFKYALTNAPSGMSINPDTGVISWLAPNVAVSEPAFPVTLSVTDQKNVTKTVSWTIKVTTEKFLFVDAVNGQPRSAVVTGTIDKPFKSFVDVYRGTSRDAKYDETYKGYFVYFKDGEYIPEGYVDKLKTVQLTPWKPSVWLAYPGHKPVFSMKYYVFNAVDAGQDNFYLDGFEINTITTDAPSEQRIGFKMSGTSTNVVFRNNKFHGLSATTGPYNQSAIMISKGGHGQHWAFQDNEFHDIHHGYGILGYSAHKVLIEDNYFHNMTDTHAIGPKQDTAYWFIRHNKIVDTRGYGIWLYGDSKYIPETDTYLPYYHDMEVSYNYVQMNKNPDETEGTALDINGSWADGNVSRVFRNTFVGTVTYWDIGSKNLDHLVNNNVIINKLPNGFYSQASPVSGIVKDNLVGTPTTGIVDAEGNLTYNFRNYLGTKGWETQ